MINENNSNIKKKKKKKEKKILDNIQSNINKLERQSNPFAEKRSKFNKKEADSKMARYLQKSKKQREGDTTSPKGEVDKDISDIFMIHTAPISAGEAARDKLRYIDASEGNPILKSEIERAKKMLSKNEFTIVNGFIRGTAPSIVGQVKGWCSIS